MDRIKRNKRGQLKWDDENMNAMMDLAIEWFYSKEDNIFIGDFFTSVLGFPTRKFTEKLHLKPYLIDKYEQIKEIQEYKLLKKGLLREYDSSLVRFVLSNKFNYTEKSDIHLTGINLKDLVSFDNE